MRQTGDRMRPGVHWLAVGTLAVSLLTAFASALPPLISTPLGAGFQKAVYVAHAPGDFSRLFVVEQTGKIKVIKNGATLATPFLDVGPLLNTQGLEYGLLSMVFHPNYQRNGYFYIYYTATTGVADPNLRRYQVTANPDVANPASGTLILHIPYNIANHRAGWMGFDDDGFMYVSTGDGGEQDPQNNASNLAVIKGKILRLDVNGPDGMPGTGDDDGFPADPDRHYHIPADNPFLAVPTAAPELWAYGLRNPWRCSMDRLTHDLWIGDVGQFAREEVDFLAAGDGGAFFGWRCLEGTLPTNYAGCPPALPPSTLPVHEYSHAQGASVIGGYVYRGCAIPEFFGRYFFGDWNGSVYSFIHTPGVGMSDLRNHTAELNITGSIFSSFGEDALGELYLCQWSVSGTAIRKIVPQTFIGPDCNRNNVNDACDIAAGTSIDINSNGVPDECEILCPADIAPAGGGDGVVDVNDLLLVVGNWGATGANVADVNGDLVVNVNDLLGVIGAWGPCQ